MALLAIATSLGLELVYSAIAPGDRRLDGQVVRIVRRTVSVLLVSVPVVYLAYVSVSDMYTDLLPSQPLDASYVDSQGVSVAERVSNWMRQLAMVRRGGEMLEMWEGRA